MYNSKSATFALMAIGLASSAHAQISRTIDLGADSPVTLVSADWGESRATPRGGAYLLDVHASLSLRNSSSRRIRGVTLEVLAQEVAPGGKGSVSVPSLDVGPGEAFPLRIDLPLLAPNNGPKVEVRLDGVLFDDMSFFGSDKLHSRRMMTVWELEARRDRKFFKGRLEALGRDGLQKEILDSVARANRPQPGVQMVRGHSTNVEPERELKFAFLHLPDAPVDALTGTVQVAGNEARAPKMQVRNLSGRPVRHLDMGWIVTDQSGRDFLAASIPSDVNLAPGGSGQVVQDTALRFSGGVPPESMTGFVSSVEFTDGSYWIPSRAALDDPKLHRVVALSPEEQRLVQIYLKKGMAGLMDELKKF